MKLKYSFFTLLLLFSLISFAQKKELAKKSEEPEPPEL
jgi:hypothetical protein